MKKLICVIFLFLLLSASARAEEYDEYDIAQSQGEAVETDKIYDALPDDADDLLGDIDMGDGLDFSAGIGKIFSNTAEGFTGILKEAVRNTAIIMAIAILCAVASSVYDSGGSEAVPSYIVLVGVIAISAVSLGSSGSFIGLGRETILQLESFSKTLLPTLTAAAVGSGAITSAAAKYAATMLFLDVLLTIADKIIMPLIYAYIAVCIGNAAFGGGALEGAARLLKWIAGILLTGIMVAFVAYLSVTGLVSGATDAVTTKVARTAISATLPVVGSIISDAASAVVAGASILRNTVGIFGILAVLAICILPFLRLGANYLLYKLAAGLTMAITDSRISKLIDNIGSAFAMIMGLVGAGGIMLFFSIFSIIKVVSGT